MEIIEEGKFCLVYKDLTNKENPEKIDFRHRKNFFLLEKLLLKNKLRKN